MTNELIEKLNQKSVLTIEEINIILDELVKHVSNRLKKVPIGNLKKCNESDMFVGNFCEQTNLIYFPLTTKQLDNDDLFHKSGLVIFRGENKYISYLVDLTFNQFKNVKMNNNLLYNLLKDGYLEFTEYNFKNYIDSFNLANNKSNIDLFSVICEEFKKFNITFNSQEDYKINNQDKLKR